VVGLEQGPLSLVSTTEELLGRKSSCSGLENRDYGCRESITLTTWHPLSTSWHLSSSTSGGRSRTQATEVSFICKKKFQRQVVLIGQLRPFNALPERM
jgi:hypothetical protein